MPSGRSSPISPPAAGRRSRTSPAVLDGARFGRGSSIDDLLRTHRELLARYRLRPDKRLGQHFLVDPEALERVLKAAGLEGRETVLEVGAGLGALTGRLADAAGHVVAIEFDRRLLPPLREVLAGRSNVELLAGDVLELDLGNLFGGRPYRVVANIPYQITSLLLRKFLDRGPSPDRLVLTVQREVAERVTSGPGDMSLLALGVQLFGSATLVGRIPAGSFLPPPDVDSAILRVDVHPTPVVPAETARIIFRLARAGFSQRRKKLRNALAAGLHLSPPDAEQRLRAAGVDPSARAETLSLKDWERLAVAWGEEG